MDTTRTALIAGALTLVSLAIAPSAVAGASTHEYVRIAQLSLRPEVLHIDEGQSVGWLNVSRHAARVTFQREAARHMICDSEQAFRLTESGLESRRIQGRQFASMCQLEPGEYRYTVELEQSASGSGTTGLVRQLHGTLVVH